MWGMLVGRVGMFKKWFLEITKHPLVVNIIGGLVLAGAIAIFSSFITMEKLGQWTKVACEYIESTLQYEVAIWEIFLTIAVLLALKYYFIRFTKPKTAQESIIGTTIEAVEEIPTETRLTDDEELILEIFMNNNDTSLNIIQIAKLNQFFGIKVFKQLRLEQLIEWLTNKNLLEVHFNYVDGTTYSLSSTGRDYILAHLMEQ